MSGSCVIVGLRMLSTPPISPVTLHRPRLDTWLRRNAAAPLRLVAAAPGSGKTVAIVFYVRESPHAAYAGLRKGCGLDSMRAEVARSLGVADPSLPLADQVRAVRAPMEIAIDNIDDADGEARSELYDLVGQLPDGVTLIYVTRSRLTFDFRREIARGTVVLCDGERLAFTADEVRELAEKSMIDYNHIDIARVMEMSEGWAIVVSALLRQALDDECGLSGIFERWRMCGGEQFREFVEAELTEAGESERTLFHRLLEGVTFPDDGRLREMEARGLFVRAADGKYRPYAALRHLSGGSAVQSARGAGIPPLVVRTLGRFEASIDGRPIEWIRKRDQQLFKYLLLKSEGASRDEIAAIFWPDADPHLASQSLRTACSHIRKAIAAIVGYDCVGHYFHANGTIVLNPTNLIVDLRRFHQHIKDANGYLDAGNQIKAAEHLALAQTLYAGPLFASDPPGDWCEEHVRVFEELHRGVQIAMKRLTVSASLTLAKVIERQARVT